MLDLSRRKLIGSLISLVAAPAIVRVSSIMPVRAVTDWDTGRGLFTEFPCDDSVKAALKLNECYDVLYRAMQEMIFRDYSATGFDPFRRSV